MDADIYPHHCAPDAVAALVQRLEALANPEQQPTPSYEKTDWRTLAGVSAGHQVPKRPRLAAWGLTRS